MYKVYIWSRGRRSNDKDEPSLPSSPVSLSVPSRTHNNPELLQLVELSAELEDKYRGAHPDLCSIQDSLQIPDIIHSTVMRMASEPSAGGGERLAEGLAGLGTRWEPATVKVGEIFVIHEAHPYMHLSREGAKALSFPLTPC